MKKFLLVFFLISSCIRSQAQLSVRDSVISFPMIGVSFAYQMPGADLAKRFGNNFNLGAIVHVKFGQNWLLGIEGDFIFSDQVKEDRILDSLSTSQGFIINSSGEYAALMFYERGFKLEVKGGKIFPLIGPNKNSGLMTTLACGILQHKIRIDNRDNDIPSIKGDYAKGYDRLTNGLSFTEFIGYGNFSNSRLINFYIGLEFTQAFTQNRRSFNFDTRMQDTSKRLDLLSGVRLGWVIPLYKRIPRQYYYN